MTSIFYPSLLPKADALWVLGRRGERSASGAGSGQTLCIRMTGSTTYAPAARMLFGLRVVCECNHLHHISINTLILSYSLVVLVTVLIRASRPPFSHTQFYLGTSEEFIASAACVCSCVSCEFVCLCMACACISVYISVKGIPKPVLIFFLTRHVIKECSIEQIAQQLHDANLTSTSLKKSK